MMKTMTCKQLGGACAKEFHADTFEEIAEMSKKHGMEMFQTGDEAHLAAMNEMRELMKSPEAMKEWFESKKREFDAMPE
jgi:PHP family Zn ribbon phosphoesterase